ncbi:MAG: hypothetical protein WBA44_15165 [Mesorhizobium sp.]
MNLGKIQAFALAAALTVVSVLTALVSNGESSGHAAPAAVTALEKHYEPGLDRSTTSSTSPTGAPRQ